VTRGNERRQIFFGDADYERFLRLMIQAKARYPVRIFGVCPMSNHVHWVAQPDEDGALSSYAQWVLGRYACYLRQRTDTVGTGHVFQSRFWCDGIDDSQHLLTVLRYVEANPLRARLVSRPEEWRWSSLVLRGISDLIDPLPIELPENWGTIVGKPLDWHELEDQLRCGPLPRRVARIRPRPQAGPVRVSAADD
jgi:REP-associated tyrosine transposase